MPVLRSEVSGLKVFHKFLEHVGELFAETFCSIICEGVSQHFRERTQLPHRAKQMPAAKRNGHTLPHRANNVPAVQVDSSLQSATSGLDRTESDYTTLLRPNDPLLPEELCQQISGLPS